MQEIPAKHIITRVKSSPFWFATDYNMNIYRGCSHGCIYCDSRSDCYRTDNFDTVRPKKDSLAIIAADLASKRKKGIIATGAMSDPYNPLEKTLKLTRGALELIDKFEFGVAIATKSALVTRDIDILQKINRRSSVLIKLTVTTAQDNLCGVLEPQVSLSSARFAALAELAKGGIFAGILAMPILPFINDTADNIKQLIALAAGAKAKFIYFGPGVTLRANQRDYFYEKLDILFPGLKQEYIKTFGDAYNCQSPRAKELFSLLAKECKKAGILYEMPAIIKAYQKPPKTPLYTQPELF